MPEDAGALDGGVFDAGVTNVGEPDGGFDAGVAVTCSSCQ